MRFPDCNCAALLAGIAAAMAAHPACADTFGAGANQFTIDFVTVGDPGNPDDAGSTGDYHSPHGGVGYEFRIGVHEISRRMVAQANAVGGLAISLGEMEFFGGNIETRPAGGITWNEAARFINWLNASKGHPVAYKFSHQPGEPGYDANADVQLWTAGDPGYDPENRYRNKDAYYCLPTEDEWYKAAYYSGSGGVYHDYATGGNTAPSPISSGTADASAVYNQPTSQGPADIDDAGGLSQYGTMAQNGNVWEWLESAFDGVNDSQGEQRTIRGGDWDDSLTPLRSSFRLAEDAGDDVLASSIGFRVVSRGGVQPSDIRLSILKSGTGEVTVAWEGAGTLHVTEQVSAGWRSLPDAMSPYKTLITDQRMFFRVVVETSPQ